MAESVDSVMREAPEVEARKLALMDAAKAQADATNKAALEGRYLTPDYQVAGLNQDQTNAIQAGREGIGAYQPYMDAATDTMNAGVANLDLAGQTLQGADTRGQFAAGQTALNNAAGATSRMGASADLATQGIGMLDRGSADIDSAQAAMKASSQADLSTAQGQMNQGIGALYAGSNAGPSATATSQGYTTRDAGTTGYDASTYGGASAGPAERYGGDTVAAARLGAAPTGTAATGIAQLTDAAPTMRAVGATAAQSNFDPNLTANQMKGVKDVTTEGMQSQDIRTAQTDYKPNLTANQMKGVKDITDLPTVQSTDIKAAKDTGLASLKNYQMGPAERVETTSFAQPGSADAYMSPYMQSVVGIQQREAQRAADVATTGRRGEQTRAGAFGGSRAAIMDAEAARNLATQQGDIQAQGSQAAYQQAQQQFNAEQAQRIQAQTANQQAGLTVGKENLAANLGVQQLGEGQINLQTKLANLNNEQQAAVQNESNRLQA